MFSGLEKMDGIVIGAIEKLDGILEGHKVLAHVLLGLEGAAIGLMFALAI